MKVEDKKVEKKPQIKPLSNLYTKPLFLDKEQKRKIFIAKIRKIGRIFEFFDWLILLVSFYLFINFYWFRLELSFLLINFLALVNFWIYHRLIFFKLSAKKPSLALNIDISFYLLMLLLLVHLFGGISSPMIFSYVIILAIVAFFFHYYFIFIFLLLELLVAYFSVLVDPKQMDFIAFHYDLFIWEVIFLSLSAFLFFILSSIYSRQRIEKEKLENFANQLVADKVKSEAVLQSMSDGVFVVDREKRLIFMNEASENLIKTKDQKERLLGRFYGNVFKFYLNDKPLDYTKDCPVQLAITEGKPNFRKDLSLLTSDKKLIFVTLSTAPIIDAAGDAQGAVAVIRDISKEKEIERMQMEFVSIASHELLTPITQVQGHLSMIVDEKIGKIDETAQKLIINAYKGIKRISRLVRDLMNISRIERGVLKINFLEVDIEKSISNIVNEFQDEAESNGLKLVFERPQKTIPKVLVDPDRLSEVLTNLIGNAIKFTKKGEITVSVSKKKNDFVVVSVKDTGIGISKENISKIFNKFYQVDSSATREAQGTGLGLFISKIIVQMMGGEIWVESKLGKGSTFYFSVLQSNKKNKKILAKK